MLATGIFATVAVNAAGANGLIHGNAGQLGTQAAVVGITLVYSLVVTLVILRVLDWVFGLRVSEEEEKIGLDISQHGERAYVMEGLSVVQISELTMPSPRPGGGSGKAKG